MRCGAVGGGVGTENEINILGIYSCVRDSREHSHPHSGPLCGTHTHTQGEGDGRQVDAGGAHKVCFVLSLPLSSQLSAVSPSGCCSLREHLNTNIHIHIRTERAYRARTISSTRSTPTSAPPPSSRSDCAALMSAILHRTQICPRRARPREWVRSAICLMFAAALCVCCSRRLAANSI